MPLSFRNALSTVGAMSWAKSKLVHKIFCARQDSSFSQQVGIPSTPPIVTETIYVLPSLSTLTSPLLSDSAWCAIENGHSDSNSEVTDHKKPCPSESLPCFQAHFPDDQPPCSAIDFPSMQFPSGHSINTEDSFQKTFSHLTLLDDIESPAGETFLAENGRRKKAVSTPHASKFSLHCMPETDNRCTPLPSTPRLPHVPCQSGILPSVFEDDSDDEEGDLAGLKRAFVWAPHRISPNPAGRKSLLPRSRLSRISIMSSSSLKYSLRK